MNKNIIHLFNKLDDLDELPLQIGELNRLAYLNAADSNSMRPRLQDSCLSRENVSAFASCDERQYLKLCRITNPYLCWVTPILSAEDVLSGLVKISERGDNILPDHLNAFDRTYWETFFNVQRDFYEIVPLVFGVSSEVNELIFCHCDRLWKLFELIGLRFNCTYRLRLTGVAELLKLEERDALDIVRLNALSALDSGDFL